MSRLTPAMSAPLARHSPALAILVPAILVALKFLDHARHGVQRVQVQVHNARVHHIINQERGLCTNTTGYNIELDTTMRRLSTGQFEKADPSSIGDEDSRSTHPCSDAHRRNKNLRMVEETGISGTPSPMAVQHGLTLPFRLANAFSPVAT